jgi:hypothetical protein
MVMSSEASSIGSVSSTNIPRWQYDPASGSVQLKTDSPLPVENKTGSRGTEVSLSDEALAKLGLKTFEKKGEGEKTHSTGEISEDEKAEVDKLKQIDRQVRTHEQAHVGAGGNLVRQGASYQYKTGPDGVRYAVAGDVQIDTSPEKDAKATIQKGQRIIAAALAPADPSPQDRRVAADAAAMISKAQMTAMKETASTGEQTGSSDSSGKTTTSKSSFGTDIFPKTGEVKSSTYSSLGSSNVDETKNIQSHSVFQNAEIGITVKPQNSFAGKAYKQAVNPAQIADNFSLTI